MSTLKNYIFVAIALSSFGLLAAFALEDQNGGQETLLDLSNIAIDFNNPAKFYFYKEEGYFKEGDVISFKIEMIPITSKARKVLGGGKFEHLKMVLVNLNTGAEETIYSADFGKPVKFGGNNPPGNYSLEITGTKKLTPLAIRIVRDLAKPMTDEERAQTYDMIHIETMYIGVLKDAWPKFNLNLTKGDLVSVSTTSDLNIKYKIFQTGKTYSLPGGEPLTFPDDGIKTLQFNVEMEKTKNGFLNLKKSDKRFIDLIIKRTPYIKPSDSGTGASGEGTGEHVDGVGGVNGDGSEEGEDPLEKLKNGDNSSLIIAETMTDLTARLDEMFKKKYSTKPKYIIGKPIDITVSSKLDLIGKQRLCKPIEFQSSNYWTYWLGVSKNANEIYIEGEKEVIGRSRDGIQSMLEHYALSVIDHVNQKANYPAFSMIETKLKDSGEFVEYAIVNELNKQKFINAETYLPYKSSWKNQNAVTDYGNSALPAEKLYLCLCNHNKISPVDVFFKYELYDKEQIER